MRVLEIGERRGRQVAAAFAGKQFARWGAEVIRVDPPDAEESAADRAFLHAGKRRVTIDLGSEEGRRLLDRLAARSDVVTSDLAPRDVEALGLFELGGEAPRVRTSISAYGLSGPYRDWQATPATLLAHAGYTFLMGDPGRAPLTLAGRYPDYQAGLIAYTATLAVWLERRRSGAAAAASIEVSVFESLASLHQLTLVQWVYQQRARQRQGNRFEGLAPITLLRCADGWWGLNILPQFWLPFLEMIERPDLAKDERFGGLGLRWQNADALEEEIQAATRDWTFERIMELGDRYRVPVGVALSLERLLCDPHLEARGFWHDVDGLRVPGAPFRFVGEAEAVEARAAAPGAHDDAVWAELG